MHDQSTNQLSSGLRRRGGGLLGWLCGITPAARLVVVTRGDGRVEGAVVWCACCWTLSRTRNNANGGRDCTHTGANDGSLSCGIRHMKDSGAALFLPYKSQATMKTEVPPKMGGGFCQLIVLPFRTSLRRGALAITAGGAHAAERIREATRTSVNAHADSPRVLPQQQGCRRRAAAAGRSSGTAGAAGMPPSTSRLMLPAGLPPPCPAYRGRPRSPSRGAVAAAALAVAAAATSASFGVRDLQGSAPGFCCCCCPDTGSIVQPSIKIHARACGLLARARAALDDGGGSVLQAAVGAAPIAAALG